MNIYQALIKLMICVLLSSCSIFYYGYSKEEWDRLTEPEKIAAKEQYKPALDSKHSLDQEKSIDARNEAFENYARKKSTLQTK